MPDFNDQLINTGGNLAIGQLQQAMGSQVPLPNFQELRQIGHGDIRGAAGHYGRRTAAMLIDRGAWANPILGVGNTIWRGLGALTHHPNWGLGNMITHIALDHDSPTGSVGGQPAQFDEQGNPTAGGVTIDPWTGQPMQGGGGMPNYMPNFTGGPSYSPQGPYAGGYQGLPDDGSGQGGPTMPNFDMSDQYNGYRDENGNPLWDENGDGHVTPNERRDHAGEHANAFGQGVTNFMVNGSPVINGIRTTDMNGLIMARQRDYGG